MGDREWERDEREYKSRERVRESPTYPCAGEEYCPRRVSVEGARCDGCSEMVPRCVDCGEEIADECSMCLECAAQSAVAREEAAADRAADEAMDAKREGEV